MLCLPLLFQRIKKKKKIVNTPEILRSLLHCIQRLSGPQGVTMDWQGAPASPSSYVVKRILRLEIPVDGYPNFNFVGRLLGPRGNSLKRVEVSTGCRVYIRGKGSIKDPGKVIYNFSRRIRMSDFFKDDSAEINLEI
ncbi:hypothetical protein HHK36_015993 [Tetracentron sinense]|uniref:KHDC4/BBP-like KH-domain type I domain-containing protein n=1 Tax=Tetracentron sinense TaxID=13715 RepID=A0A834Z4G9_TETSI|nr:hypothetical protein HHK36_015993 [Tetracentron sinense]